MVLSLYNRALVGKFKFIKLSILEILEWIHLKWKSIIKEAARVFMLMNGWICFQFIFEEDRKKIDIFWVIEKGSLVLNRWHSDSCPWKEKIKKRPLWVMFPVFPLDCWSLAGFMVE